MTVSDQQSLYVPVHHVRFVTAAALFDGHDAAINIMRRILQTQGAEVIHLGHDRSVRAGGRAVLEEDAQVAGPSSTGGGHVEYFEYLAQALAEAGAGHVADFRRRGRGRSVSRAAWPLLAVRIFSPRTASGSACRGLMS